MPKVSVIVPNYNHARFLRQRIDSILSQTFQDFELILLDDASTDDSRSILSSYASDPRVAHVVFNEKNSGSPFKQWNKGVRLARGEYVWIAESDDYADPRLLERLIPLLDADPRLAYAYCRSRRVSADSGTDKFGDSHLTLIDPQKWEHDFLDEGIEHCRRYFVRGNSVPNASAVLFRKAAYDRAGDADENLRLCGDWKLWAAMALAGKVAYIAEPLNHFRFHEGSARSKTAKINLDVIEHLGVMRWMLAQVTPEPSTVKKTRRVIANLWVPAVLSRRTPASMRREILRLVREVEPNPFRCFLGSALTTVRLKFRRHWRELTFRANASQP